MAIRNRYIRARNAESPALDMTYCRLRGVSPVHMQYLEIADVSATMTLSIVLENGLWGMISFHRTKPKLVSPDMCQILTNFLPVFCLQLDLLRAREACGVSHQMNIIQQELEGDVNLAAMLDRAGSTPDQCVIDELLELAQKNSDGMVALDRLEEALAETSERRQHFAGALIVTNFNGRALCFFRK